MTRDGGSRPNHLGPRDLGAAHEPFVTSAYFVRILTLEVPGARGGASGLKEFLRGADLFLSPATVEGG